MTLDELDLFPEPDDREPRKCYRHQWGAAYTEVEYQADQYGYVDLHDGRSIAVGLGHSLTVPVPVPGEFACSRCGKVRNEAVAKRNKRNRQRGGAFERTVAKKLGGRKTGPLGGRDDVMVGELFAIQTKRAQRFALTEARVYLADLRRTYPTRTPLVVHALPGERGGVVILDLESWVELHGKDGQP